MEFIPFALAREENMKSFVMDNPWSIISLAFIIIILYYDYINIMIIIYYYYHYIIIIKL
jgi:hypothetical protein